MKWYHDKKVRPMAVGSYSSQGRRKAKLRKEDIDLILMVVVLWCFAALGILFLAALA
jgi:hypothetical protein